MSRENWSTSWRNKEVHIPKYEKTEKKQAMRNHDLLSSLSSGT
jgi:hypothetical protein